MQYVIIRISEPVLLAPGVYLVAWKLGYRQNFILVLKQQNGFNKGMDSIYLVIFIQNGVQF